MSVLDCEGLDLGPISHGSHFHHARPLLELDDTSRGHARHNELVSAILRGGYTVVNKIEQLISYVKPRTSERRAAAVQLWPALGMHLPCAALLSALSISTGVAAQQHAPSDAELRSMYCVEVIRAEISVQRHLISASDAAAASALTPALRQQWIDTSVELMQGLARLEVVRYKLQAYMMPRIAALDSFALATAMRQGATDFEQSSAGADQCAADCAPSQVTNAQPPACGTSCGDKASLSRVSACEKPTWLPP